MYNIKMGGGLVQLVAFGLQDSHLINKDDYSFFKTIYKRYTNFAMESIEQTLDGDYKFGGKVSSVISRNGDLLQNIMLEIDFEGNICNNAGHSMIEYVDLEIGGQLIDRQYGEWLEILSELTIQEEKKNLVNIYQKIT